jgi:putative FmdB family regulatory protein
MPLYEFRCDQCGKSFELAQTFDEHARGMPACPRCKNASRVQQQLSSFTPVTSRKT